MWKKYPILRGMASYSIMYPGANVFQQVAFRNHPGDERASLKKLKEKEYIIKRLKKVDWLEASRFMIYGGLFHATLVHNWMHFLQKVFPGTSNRQILKKILCDQLFFAPFGLSCFYAGLSLLEFKTSEEIYEEILHKLPKTWLTGACIWPFLQGFNWKFVPLKNQVVYISICAFFWTTLMAYFKNEKIGNETGSAL